MNIYSCLLPPIFTVVCSPVALTVTSDSAWLTPLLFFNLFQITQTHQRGMFYYNDHLLTLHIVFNISVHFYVSASEFVHFIILHRCCLFIYFYFHLRYDGHTALYKFKVYQIAFCLSPRLASFCPFPFLSVSHHSHRGPVLSLFLFDLFSIPYSLPPSPSSRS